MGGTGALVFAGDHNFQLIISRRHDLLDGGPWGFTITRRLPPDVARRSSTFMYLAPGGTILAFDNTAPLIFSPNGRPQSIAFELNHGTIVKLYEYRLQPKALASNILFDLNYHLSLLLPEPVLPIRLYERRGDFTGHSMEATLVGIKNRLKSERAPLEIDPLLGSISLRF